MNAEIHHLPFVAVGRPAEAIATAHPNSANAPEAAPSSWRPIRSIMLFFAAVCRMVNPVRQGSAQAGQTKKRPSHIRLDPSRGTCSKLAAAAALVGAAYVGSGIHAMRSDSSLGFMPHFGLGQLANIVSEAWPTLLPIAQLVVGIEQILLAAFLFYVSLAFLRNFEPPRPAGQHEGIRLYGRQLRMSKWHWALYGIACCIVGYGLIWNADSLVNALTHRSDVQTTAAIFICLLGAASNLLGVHWLGRFAYFVFVPSARTYMVVFDTLHSYQQGFGNRIVIGDGALAPLGQITIRHEDLISARLYDPAIRRTLLGLCKLELTFLQNGDAKTLLLESPGTVRDLRQLVTFLQTEFIMATGPITFRSPYTKVPHPQRPALNATRAT